MKRNYEQPEFLLSEFQLLSSIEEISLPGGDIGDFDGEGDEDGDTID